MRIFNSTVEAVREIERDLWEMGHRIHPNTMQDKNVKDDPDFDTRELVGYDFMLINGNDWQDSFHALGMKDWKACIDYVLEEFTGRVYKPANINPGYAWVHREEVWKPFLERDQKFSYTYPERIHALDDTAVISSINQLEVIEAIHKEDSSSRQLVINIYDAGHDHHKRLGKARVPCTMHFQFLHRDPSVFIIQSMRSLDLYTHLAIDLSILWLMVSHYAKQWGAECPRAIMQVGSLHGYEKDMKLRKIF